MRWGVESICTQLTELGVPIAPSTYYDHINREPSRRELRDGELKEHISRVHAANYGVYGARKVWLTLNREGIEVARCTVERLMTKLGLSGTTRGKARRTTIADPATARPADLVQRRFGPPAPNRLWVADLTYVSTWAGFAYVAFVTDAYARRILGWRVASTMATSMVLDAIEQAIWTRQQEGVLDLKDVIHHTDRGSQYTSIRFSERLAEAGIQPSVGAVGSSYDNALAETINGLYKTELIKPGKPWRSIEDVELATAVGIGSGRLLSADSYKKMVSTELRGKTRAQPGCPTCFEQNDGYSYGLGIVISGHWLLQNPMFAGYAAVEAYLPSQRVAVAVAVTYAPEAFDDQGNYRNQADILFRKIGAEVAPNDAPPMPPGR
ncbi:Putative transposase for insertion sequence element IS6110 [Mycobacterium tuberculosis]|nr:Putative transposase for insertion sequence element IS6110 [Mycobacterium tuberculosis]